MNECVIHWIKVCEHGTLHPSVLLFAWWCRSIGPGRMIVRMDCTLGMCNQVFTYHGTGYTQLV